jgi:transcriptional repressor NrdR
MVEKRSGSYEPFDRNKLIQGIFNAIKKRPVNIDDVEKIADSIENHYANELKNVAPSKEIGELVLAKLKEIDPISYIRFASVYEDFTDVTSFVAVISKFENNEHSEGSASENI